MAKTETDKEWIFWTTIAVSFVLIAHNSADPLFITAFTITPFLALLFYYKRSFYPLILYILIFGILGRIIQYYSSTYGSDALMAVRDFIGYFVHGKNVYKEMIMAQSGLTPFTYLPFSLFWYLPAYVFNIDLRFFEMLISSLVPVMILFYGKVLKTIKILPFLAVMSLTPFLIDLSADGSNDNSAIFILLSSIILFVYSIKTKSRFLAVVSAIILGFAAVFKHYVFFYLLFFLPYLYQNKKLLVISNKRYIFYTLLTIFIISGPFIMAAPEGFFRSLTFIELTNWHKTWGWSIWVALRDALHFTLTTQQMWIVRTIITVSTAILLLRYFRLNSYNKVFVASGVTLFIYLAFSQWTTYAYFTFLVPLLGLSAFHIEEGKT